MAEQSLTTLEYIHLEAKREFSEKGYRSASLRNILKSVGLTTGAFYGTIKAKRNSLKLLWANTMTI